MYGENGEPQKCSRILDPRPFLLDHIKLLYKQFIPVKHFFKSKKIESEALRLKSTRILKLLLIIFIISIALLLPRIAYA